MSNPSSRHIRWKSKLSSLGWRLSPCSLRCLSDRSTAAIATTAVDGSVTLTGITSDNVSVNTVDGDVSYDGTIQDGGRYVLSTHDGNLNVFIPGGASARISIDTFSGDLDTDFPVELEGDFGKKRISFTVGTGKALVELSAFDGTISLKKK